MLLEIKDLSVEYYRRKEKIPALKNVSLSLEKGQSLGVVGESGSGKSTVALSILRLIGSHEGRITSGEILFEGKNLLDLDEESIRRVRGKDIAIVFQDPFTSLNPVMRIGEQIGEALQAHDPSWQGSRLDEKIDGLLRQVRLPEPERISRSYPHQVSGGQRQRAMIAMSIANHPKLLIADEPTTALDVTVQKEILDLLGALQKELDMSILLITHHFGIVAHYTTELAVLYRGEAVEKGKTMEVLKNPRHDYTQRLLHSLPGRKKAV